MSNLLDNAKNSIELGLEDFRTARDQEGQSRRILSAIRNFYAGSLLLCNHVLWENSPPGTDGSLAYARLEPRWDENSETIGWYPPKGRNQKFAGVTEIIERFRSLGMKLDEENLDKLRTVRNNVEHGYSAAGLELGREAISVMKPVIFDLVVNRMKRDILDVFDRRTWEEILKNEEVREIQKRKCLASFSEVDWESAKFGDICDGIYCPECGLALVEQTNRSNSEPWEIIFRCTVCLANPDRDDIFEGALERTYREYVDECPKCGRLGWIQEEGCVFCDEGLLFCESCRSPKEPGEFDFETGECKSCTSTREWEDRESGYMGIAATGPAPIPIPKLPGNT